MPPGPPPPTSQGPRPGGITPLGWALRGLVLLCVSVASGLIWLAVTGGGGSDTAQPQRPVTKHHFKPEFSSDGYQACADVSTGQIKSFFATRQECEHLARVLYTTTIGDQERVLTSVVSVRMPNEATARQLNKLLTRDDTGNVLDLVSADYPVPDGFPELDEDYGYDSQQQGRLVVVGESAYFASPDTDDARLKSVTTDALKLAHQQDSD